MSEKHTIGKNSMFDGEIDIIEMFVRCSKNKKDLLSNFPVFYYSMSVAINYLNNFNEYINEGTCLWIGKGCDRCYDKNIQQVLNQRNVYRRKLYNIPHKEALHLKNEPTNQSLYPIPDQYKTKKETELEILIPKELYEVLDKDYTHRSAAIKENLEFFNDIILKTIGKTRANFDRTNTYIFDDVLNIFTMIADLFQGVITIGPDIHNKLLDFDLLKNKIFLMTCNNEWCFANSYMYAFVEGIIIFFVAPTFTRNSEEQNILRINAMIDSYMCIKNGEYTLNTTGLKIRDIYYCIINDESLDIDEKEASIFGLWYLVYKVGFNCKSQDLVSFYPGSDRFKTIEDCLIYTKNYMSSKNLLISFN